MIPPTLALGLDINTKHTHLQALARQAKERQGEETCQRPVDLRIVPQAGLEPPCLCIRIKVTTGPGGRVWFPKARLRLTVLVLQFTISSACNAL